jgi:hypothetical protein
VFNVSEVIKKKGSKDRVICRDKISIESYTGLTTIPEQLGLPMEQQVWQQTAGTKRRRSGCHISRAKIGRVRIA